MAKKGGDTKLKRQLAPAFWEINRKEKRFAITIKPGPHAKQSSYPLAII
ncbi:MAG: 30S ribosomal protein S4e, partial [Nitrososphaeraceae archaeon]